MARQVIPNEGATILLDYILRDDHVFQPQWEFFLFSAPAVPTEAIIWDDVTECLWAGYDRIAVDRGRWAPAEVIEGVPTSVYGLPRLEWSVLENGATVRGWGMRELFTGRIVDIQASDNLYTPPLGSVFWIRPRVQLTTFVVC